MNFMKSLEIFETINNGKTKLANKLRRLEGLYKDSQSSVERTYGDYTDAIENRYADVLAGIKDFCGLDLSAPESKTKLETLQSNAQDYIDTLSGAVLAVDAGEADQDDDDKMIDDAIAAGESVKVNNENA